jgi:hypothetical protein
MDIELPDARGVGSTASWTTSGLPDLGVETERETTFDATGTSHLRWVTGREDSADGTAIQGTVQATVIVDLDARQKLLELWTASFGAALDKSLALFPAVTVLLPQLANTAAFNNAALPPAGSASVLVTHHEVAEPAHFTWTYENPGYSTTTFTGESCNGLEGSWHVTVTSVLNGGGLAGNGTGSGTFLLPAGEQPGHLRIEHPVVITAPATGNGTHTYDLTVSVQETENVTLQLDGTATASGKVQVLIDGQIAAESPFSFSSPFHIEVPVTFGGDCAIPQ